MSQTFIVARPRPGATTNQNAVLGWIQRVDIWLTRWQGRKDLCQLDDRMLADIGISRRDAGISREDAFRNAGGILP